MNEFEQFIKKHGLVEHKTFEREFSSSKFERRPDGEYSNRYTQHAWEGWISCAFSKSK